MKKKSLRKVLAASVAAMLMCAPMMGITAYAADGDPVSPSISVGSSAHDGDKYDAFQIFSGTIDGGKLTSIEWSDAFNSKSGSFITKLIESSLIGGDFSSGMTAEQVSKVIQGYKGTTGEENDKTREFARIVAEFIETESMTPTATIAKGGEAVSVSPGYYLMVTNTTTAGALTRGILEVAGNIVIAPKVSVPEINKDVKTGEDPDGNETWAKQNTAAIGDTIKYKLTSTIPDMTGYNRYYYIVSDTMDKGITPCDKSEFTAFIDADKDGIKDSDESEYTKFTVDTMNLGDNGTAIKIVFNDFLDLNGTDANIVVRYTGILNENASLATIKDDANKNTVDLIYSNNPNYDYEGNKSTDNPDEPPTRTPDDDNPDKPDVPNDPTNPNKEYDSPVGVTPEKSVVTYTTNLEIFKYDGADGSPLNNVEFTLSGTALNEAFVYGNEFVEDSDGSYYKLLTGEYTTTAPVEETKAKYVLEGDNPKTYKLKDITKTITTASDAKFVKATNQNGSIVFEGLNAGKYKLSETGKLDGYNDISPITVKIEPTFGTTDDGKDYVTWKYSDKASNLYRIENNQGSLLPSTGGVGTTIFYISGGLLVLGSAVLLVTKKRMSLNEEK